MQSVEILGKDTAGYIDYSLPAPTSCWDVLLAVNTPVTVAVPAGFNRAFFSFSPGTNVWVTLDNSTPVIPSGSAASTQELNPAARQLNNQTPNIKLISDTAAFVNIRFDMGQ